jgi:hypothetical protein
MPPAVQLLGDRHRHDEHQTDHRHNERQHFNH